SASGSIRVAMASAARTAAALRHRAPTGGRSSLVIIDLVYPPPPGKAARLGQPGRQVERRAADRTSPGRSTGDILAAMRANRRQIGAQHDKTSWKDGLGSRCPGRPSTSGVSTGPGPPKRLF